MHTHTHTHMRAHTRTHIHTHTYTQETCIMVILEKLCNFTSIFLLNLNITQINTNIMH